MPLKKVVPVLLFLACGTVPSTSLDSGVTDSGVTDSGVVDSGMNDSGTVLTDAGTNACALLDGTTATASVSSSGCAIRQRDTSSCKAAREAEGLSGFWLEFSCRVTLTRAGGVVKAESDGQPDHLSNYFADSSPCHETYTGAIQNPNRIAVKSLALSFPEAPTMTSQTMMGATVGIALNGVSIFGNFAAPGDDIFTEAKTFDRCGAHPQMTGSYHYHGEPFAISNADSKFIGVLRDGYPIYGRLDPDGSSPTLDSFGGHSGPTLHAPSGTPYHYHLNLQTSMGSATFGQQQWFLTKGSWRGTPGACTGCN